MKQEHQDLFIELLIEKGEALRGGIAQQAQIIQQQAQVINELKEKQQQPEAAPTFVTQRHGENTTIDMIQETIDAYEARITELTEQCNTLLKERDAALEEKKDRRGLAASVTTYKTMVDYAKSQGFTFLRMDKMKEAIEASKSTAASGFAAKPEGSNSTTTIDGNKVEFEPNKHISCPHGMKDLNGKKVNVGEGYCRHKCPYYNGIDTDQQIVFCDKSKQ